jgi:hypothetical protein
MLTNLIQKHPAVRRLQASHDELKKNLHATRHQLHLEMQRNAPRPARMIVEGGMSRAELEEVLAGTESNPVTKALRAILNERIVELSDKCTDPPRERAETSGGTIPGYTAEERLYDAGRCAAVAELLEMLQDLSKPKDAAGREEAQ